MIELSEVAGPKGKLFRLIREASRGLGRQRSGAALPRPEHALTPPCADDAASRRAYLIETPLDPAQVAEVMAGEQSLRHLHARRTARPTRCASARRATVERVEELGAVARAEPAQRLARAPAASAGPWRRARVTISFPVANVGANLPTLAATVAGNLYDLGEVTGLRLERMQLPAGLPRALRAAAPGHRRHARADRRGAAAAGRHHHQAQCRPVGRGDRPRSSAQLCEAGVDFIKDDEICADPDHAPLAERVPAVMARGAPRIRSAPAST